MLSAMKDSFLACLWGGFTAHTRSCSQRPSRPSSVNIQDRDRSPHDRQETLSPGTVTCAWSRARKDQGQRETPSDLYRKIEKPKEILPPKQRQQPPKRPRYFLDLKSDNAYLETDIDFCDKSRSFESTDSGIHNSTWNTVKSHSRIIEADIHREDSKSTFVQSPVAIAIGPNGEPVQYQPIRGILKKPRIITPQEHYEDGTQKREAFMDLLAKRYPKFADKISGTASEDGFPVRGRRPRDHQRRATVVTYNPHHDRAVEFDDRSDTMSNIEGPVASFQRGGWLRNSMPIVRSPPNTYDTRRGLVFLVVGDETKKAELPNEITHLDTVRALFVRSFLGRLTMEYLESPKRKIYILDPITSIYYQLEDLRDIKDRSVLRLYECDSNDPQKVRDPPPEVRGKVVQTPRDATLPQGAIYPVDTPATAVTDQVRKSQTLPSSMTHSYPPFYEGEYDVPRPKSSERSRSLPRSHGGPDYAYVTYHSPERSQAAPDCRLQSTPPDRPNLRTIPENLQIQNGFPVAPVIYEDLDNRYYQAIPGAYHNRAMSPPVQRTEQPVRDPLRRALSPPPGSVSQTYDTFRAPGGPAPGAPPQTYVVKGVRANTVVSPLRATGPNKDPRVPNNRHSLAFTPVADVSPSKGVTRSQSYRVSSDMDQPPLQHRARSVTPQPTPQDPDTRFRMEKMEEQIASLAAWVQTAVSNSSSRASSVRSNTSNDNTPSEVPNSNTGSIAGKEDKERVISEKGLSDISSVSSQNTITQNIKDCILTIKRQTSDLKMDLRNIRRMNQLNNESVQESIHETMKKIAKALKIVPGAEQQLLRQQRADINIQWQKYLEHRSKVYKELSDLEASVEEIRADVLSRQCRVNMSDVEAMALMLSNITKSFGDLKAKFPDLQKELKIVMAGEMEVVVKEERLLKDEPDAIEEALKRCKKLTGTLFTLKRLASVQEQRPLQVPPPASVGGKIPSLEDKKVLLENIKAMVPNHDARLQSLEAADASRERKRKIVTQQESLKFGKSLEIASKSLKSGAKDVPEKSGSQSKTAESVDSGSKDTIVQTTSVISTATKTTSSIYSDVRTSKEKSSDSNKKEDSSKSTELAKDDDDDDAKRQVAILAVKKDAARAAFFSSLTTPPTSPAEEKRFASPPRTTTMDYTVRISPVRVMSSGETKYTVTNGSTNVPSHTTHTSAYAMGKPTSLPLSTKRTSGYKSASPSPSPPTPSYSIMSDHIRKCSPSSIPRFTKSKISSSADASEKVVKKPVSFGNSKTPIDKHIAVDQEKVGPKTSTPKVEAPKVSDKKPSLKTVTQSTDNVIGGRPKKVPPPPPPRKSSRLPGHVTSVTAEIYDGAATNVNSRKIETPLDGKTVQDSSILLGHQPGISESGVVCTSTPKSAIPPKPSSKFEKGIIEKMVAGAQSSTLCSDQKEKLASSETVSVQYKVNGGLSHDLKREEREGSSDSTESSSSLDSQQGGVMLRRKIPPAKKQKPPPPQRKSSLSQQQKDNNTIVQKINGNEEKMANTS